MDHIEFYDLVGEIHRNNILLVVIDEDLSLDQALLLLELLKYNNSVKTLRIKGGFSPEVWRALADLLVVNTALTQLKIVDTNIGDMDLGQVSAALKINRFLKTLKFNQNVVSHAGLQKLAEALRMNLSLTDLEFEDNHIHINDTSIIIDALVNNKRLNNIRLCGYMFDRQASQKIAEVLKANQTLEILDLSDNVVSCADVKVIANGLAENKSLKELYLNETEINHVGIETIMNALKYNTSLTMLFLHGAKIRDDLEIPFIALAFNTTVRRLHHGFYDLNTKKIKKFLKRQINSNQDIYKLLQKHAFYSVPLRNNFVKITEKKQGGLENKIPVKINCPSLKELVFDKITSTIGSNEKSFDTFCQIPLPQELSDPIKDAYTINKHNAEQKVKLAHTRLNLQRFFISGEKEQNNNNNHPEAQDEINYTIWSE